MFKRWASFIIIIAMILSYSSVFAEVQQAPQNYNITVTEDGGKYNFANVELTFKKNSIEEDMQPVTFEVVLYAENGVPYIDINPSVQQFAKDVKVKVKKGVIALYDIATGEIVDIQFENYNFKVEHFSRYVLMD